MRRFFLIVFSLLICRSLLAQVAEYPAADDTIPVLSRLQVEQDSRLGKMLDGHIKNNKKRDGIKGYRIEIFFSSAMNAKEKALEKKANFLSLYPEHNVHIKFAAPNFKVRVGDFRTKNEALKLQKKIKDDYPGAFIVPDIIEFPLLKRENYERSD
ncbi:MAG: SPOR domain-containing protein [Prolixibacteraceae bacterium]